MNSFNVQSINYMQTGDFSQTCPTCNRPYWDTGESTARIPTCECWRKQFEPFQPYQPYQPFQPYAPPYNELVKMGWKCPCCGGGVAPVVDRCPCTPLPTITWTTITNLTIGSDGTAIVNNGETDATLKGKNKRKKK